MPNDKTMSVYPTCQEQVSEILKEEANVLARTLDSRELEKLPPRITIAVRREIDRLRMLALNLTWDEIGKKLDNSDENIKQENI